MAYFNHAFNKVFLGTGPTLAGPTPFATTGGYITSVNINTSALTTPGSFTGVNNSYFGIFDAKTFKTIQPTAGSTECCPFFIASTPVVGDDKIGPFAGGYRESNKSKIINPRYVRQFYYVAPCIAQQSVVSVGVTPGTLAGNASVCEAVEDGDISVDNFQGGTNCENCCKEFLCGETYYLRIDVKGSPALRFLNHQAYQTMSAYTGCCPGPAPTAVDSTMVFLQWAKQVSTTPYFVDQQGNKLIRAVVFSEDQQASTFDNSLQDTWYPSGTTSVQVWNCVTKVYDTVTVNQAQWFEYYPEGVAHIPGKCAGMRLYGAYEDTRFGNCTFQVTDFFEKEPVKILASEVDYTGDPCIFNGLCVYTECYGRQAMGLGEQVLRDLIVSQSYLQNYVGSGMDFRIREITQGDDIINSVNRAQLYHRYYILHSVPRFNNPTGTFDNDQYMLEIITSVRQNSGATDFEAIMNNLLACSDNCGTTPTVYGCNYCCVPADSTWNPAPEPPPVP